MTPDPQLRELPANFVCPSCELEMKYDSALQNGGRPLSKDTITICSGCASILKVGDSNYVLMQKEEILKLDEKSRALLLAAVVAAVVAVKNNLAKKN